MCAYISRLLPKPYNTFAIKPIGLGLGSDCVQMHPDAGTSNTVISMEVQVAHTLASASSSLWLCCGGASPCNKRNFIIVTTIFVRAAMNPRVQ